MFIQEAEAIIAPDQIVLGLESELEILDPVCLAEPDVVGDRELLSLLFGEQLYCSLACINTVDPLEIFLEEGMEPSAAAGNIDHIQPLRFFEKRFEQDFEHMRFLSAQLLVGGGG